MGRILRIEVDNFKSYKGHQVIGPFKDFTAIMGPNGAGKSNLMDAISFVVGVDSKHLRGEKLHDLVFNADGRRGKDGRTASVSLVYVVAENEVDGLNAGDELVFTRKITRARAVYRLQGENVEWAVYNRQLKEIGILVKARNFLVFQGDVESVASKTPQQLCAFFEEISGSADCRQEYDRLKAEMMEAETDTIFTYKQKRGITLERKEAKEQKEEADRFNQKLDQMEQLKCEYYMWKLFHVQNQLEAREQDIAQVNDELNDVDEKGQSSKDAVNAKKKALAQSVKASNAAEKRFKAAKKEFAKQEPATIKAKEAIAHVERKEADAQAAVDQLETDWDAQQAEINEVTKVLDDLKLKEQDITTRHDEALKAAGEGAATSLTEDQLTELSQIKERVRKETVAVRAEINSVRRDQAVDEERLEQVQHSHDQLAQRKADLVADRDNLDQRKAKMQTTIDGLDTTIKETSKELARAQGEQVGLKTKREGLVKQLDEVRVTLRNAKAQRADSKKERKMKDTIEAMMRHFDGVHGRLFDICKPTHRKYDLALSMAMGKNMDAVVVDKESTARECIKYLRDQRAGVLTFLPLDTLQAKELNQRWRSLGDSYKLAVDVLEYAKEIDPAVRYALGGVIVCSTLDAARHLCFQMKEKAKAVTLDGDIISRNGDMTGGTTDADRNRASRFEQQGMDHAKKKRERIEDEIAQVDRQLIHGIPAKDKKSTSSRSRSGKRPSSSSAASLAVAPGGNYVQELQMAVANATNRKKFAEMDLKLTQEKFNKLDSDIQATERGLSELVPELERLKKDIATRDAKIVQLDDSIHAVEGDLMAEFENKYAIDNVLESEKNALTRKEVLNTSLSSLHEEKSKLEAHLHYLESRDLKKKLTKAQRKLADAQKSKQKKTTEAESAAVALEELKQKCDELEKAFDAAKLATEATEQEMAQLAVEREAFVKERSEVLKRLTGVENQIEKLNAKQEEVLQEAQVAQIAIPRQQGDDDDDMDEGKDDDANSNSTPDDGTRQKVDFSDLPAERKKKDLSDKETDKIDKEYQGKIHALEMDIEKSQPNMKANERFMDVSERLKTTDGKLTKARQMSKRAEKSFEQLRQTRHETFMKMFQHVEQTIDEVYKELTKSPAFPMGGNAYLTLDNTDEPYLGGIKYNAMPPNKRFRDMEQLSGGEKTVAALALLFAIHSYHPSPFFVMDEIDAALDNTNVSIVSNYILQRSKDFQSLVISLKDNFYDKADALVGVYRERDLNCSQSLTLDMTTYAA